MTLEELAAAGVSPVREVHDSENHEDGEIRSVSKSDGEEDLANVDADPGEFVSTKSAKSYPPAFVFGGSKVTADLIKDHLNDRYGEPERGE
jgi:hypothetical protein